MFKKTASVAVCMACLWSIAPAMAAPNEMPQGKRDEKAMKETKKEVTMQRKENKEADKNVDSIVKNRK